MQHVVASVRAFLQRQYAQGIVSRTLHLQIDTPQVYRLERLPRALPWTQVQALLGSINRSERFGLRDFTLLYLAAAYGLRSGELVRLTLDDIDWRGRTLRVSQTKTKNAIRLPLTDEAASFLIDYLRRARPESSHRQLFLRMRAPDGALKPTAVHDVLEHRIGLSGLKLPQLGTHVLRHSLAAHLLRQGVGIKTIGDALGHRDIESTSIYLRLGVDDLREVALPAPPSIVTSPCQPLVPARTLPRVRVYRPNRHLPKRFQSSLAASLQRFLELKRTLGRHYAVEAAILSHWDDFLHRQYPQARKVRAAMVYDWAKELVQPPRLISATEMALIIQCAHQLPPSSTNPLRAETIALGLMLLFCCGLRRGELLRLKLGDIDRNQRLIRIAFTKFHKSRLVPLDPTVADELEYYLQQRHRMKLPMTPDSFLLWSGRRSPEVYAGTSLLTVWRRLCLSVKVLDARGRSPRLHDLRHSFALNALQRWYAEGADVQTKLHSLATYLGHVNPVSTHYYLQLTPELRQSASQRFHQRFAPLFTVGGVV